MATKKKEPTPPPLAPRRDADTVAEMAQEYDVVVQRAGEIRDQINKLEAKIGKLHQQKTDLTRELAAVWNAA